MAELQGARPAVGELIVGRAARREHDDLVDQAEPAIVLRAERRRQGQAVGDGDRQAEARLDREEVVLGGAEAVPEVRDIVADRGRGLDGAEGRLELAGALAGEIDFVAAAAGAEASLAGQFDGDPQVGRAAVLEGTGDPALEDRLVARHFTEVGENVAVGDVAVDRGVLREGGGADHREKSSGSEKSASAHGYRVLWPGFVEGRGKGCQYTALCSGLYYKTHVD